MPKTKSEKQKLLTELGENLDKQKAMVFVDYKGLGTRDLVALRKQLMQAGSRLTVAKKTLLAKAFEQKGIPVDVKSLEGQIGVIFAYGDPLESIQRAGAFATRNENLKILGGYVEYALQTAERIKAIASLPSREQLLGKVLRTLAAPLCGCVVVLEGNIKGLITVLALKAKT